MGDAFRDGDETHREDGASRKQKKKPKRMVWLSRGKDDARRAIVNEEKVYDELSEKACCDGSTGVGPLEFLRVGVDAGCVDVRPRLRASYAQTVWFRTRGARVATPRARIRSPRTGPWSPYCSAEITKSQMN